jgi:streptogrisin C
MGRRRIVALAAAAVLTVATAGFLVLRDRAEGGSSSELLAAMRRDLHLTAAQATARLAGDERAARTVGRLRDLLGAGFGGAWLSPDGAVLTVAVTDAAQAATVRAAGAQPRIVTRSEADLADLKARLDRNAERAPYRVSDWHLDPESNRVVLVSTAANDEAALQFAAASGVPGDAVRVVTHSGRPRPFADVRGGTPYVINSSTRCSVGFPVQGGFVTAGHCGAAGDTVTTRRGAALGTFADSSFPGNDYAWVKVTSNWSPRPVVDDYTGGTIRVAGSQESPVGATVCRSGSTTGWHCGTILARDATVRYEAGLVTGVTRTDVCAEPGDSGGAWITGTQAQGVTSGGTGDCATGGTTYFQPINEILAHYRLKLMTSTNTVNE